MRTEVTIIVFATLTALSASETTVDPCYDKISSCNYYSSACNTKGPLKTWINLYCPRYCNLCDILFTTTPSPSTTPGDRHSTYDNVHSGYCYYDGKEYTLGEEWQDGCKYNCTCVSAHKGYYTCIPACPQLLTPTVIPSECYYKQYGCCKKLMCTEPANNGTTDLIPFEDRTTPGSTVPTTSAKPCHNKLNNCHSFPYACVKDAHIRQWATEYCSLYCDLC